jgi:hypothetical protein
VKKQTVVEKEYKNQIRPQNMLSSELSDNIKRIREMMGASSD